MLEGTTPADAVVLEEQEKQSQEDRSNDENRLENGDPEPDSDQKDEKPKSKFSSPIPLASEVFPQIDIESLGKDNENVYLYEALQKVFKIVKPIQETFQKYQIPMVVTRSIAVYLWALELRQARFLQIDQNLVNTIGQEGSLISDIDYIVPAEMLPEIDAALEELVKANKIKLTDPKESESEKHDRGLKSLLFRQFQILDNGEPILTVELFGGFGMLLDRDYTDSITGETTSVEDFKTMQAIYVKDNGEIESLFEKINPDAFFSPNLRSIRRINIGGCNIRHYAGEELIRTYREEVNRLRKLKKQIPKPGQENNENPKMETAWYLAQKEKMLVLKLKIAEILQGIETKNVSQ